MTSLQYVKRTIDLRPGDILLTREGQAWRYDGYDRDAEFPAFHVHVTMLDQRRLVPRLVAGGVVQEILIASGDHPWPVIAIDVRARSAWQRQREGLREDRRNGWSPPLRATS